MFDRHVYYLAHREELLAYAKRYLELNRDSLRCYAREYAHKKYSKVSNTEKCKRYRCKNSDHISEYKHEWYLAHRSKTLEKQRVRDAKRSLESRERHRVLERERYRRLKGL